VQVKAKVKVKILAKVIYYKVIYYKKVFELTLLQRAAPGRRENRNTLPFSCRICALVNIRECESDDSAWGHHRVQARKEGHVVHRQITGYVVASGCDMSKENQVKENDTREQLN
jgi:hypothetical protein